MSLVTTLALAIAMQTGGGAGAGEQVSAAGPTGNLSGSLMTAGAGAPVLLILPGSGPTDRDGNNPLGVAAAPYRLLAEALRSRGVSTLRVDKRGLGGSAGAGDGNAVTIPDYVADTRAWLTAARRRTGAACVWLMGHSEGALVALASAQESADLCGLVLVAAPGRRFSEVLREQLRANPANAPLLDQALPAIDRLERSERVDVAGMHPALAGVFAPAVQGFLISLFSFDPAQLAERVRVPMLIVHGQRDLQVGEADARRLAAANAGARLVLVPTMNHVLKTVPADDRAANIASYADPSLPISGEAVEAIARFVTGGGQPRR